MNNYSVIIPAAGSSQRFDSGNDKLLAQLLIDNKIVIQKTIEVFLNDDKCERIIIGCNEQVKRFVNNCFAKYINTKIFLTNGSKSRSETIYNCLKFLDDSKVVLIHDGARCFLKQSLIDDLLNAYSSFECDAVIPGLDLTDAIKKVDHNKNLIESLDREEFILVQTPQLFEKNLLLEAYSYLKQLINISKIDSNKIYDDCHVLHLYDSCAKIKYISGDLENKKITFRKDIE